MSKGWDGFVPLTGSDLNFNEIRFKAKYWEKFGHFGSSGTRARPLFPFHYNQFTECCVKTEESKILASSFHRFAVTLNGIL